LHGKPRASNNWIQLFDPQGFPCNYSTVVKPLSHTRRRQARVHASCSLCGGCPPRTSPRTCKSARQRCSASSTNIQLVLFGVIISLSHVHIHLLFLLLVFAFSRPGVSDPASYSCHPHPHTHVTPILCTRIHASQVYEVHYGFGVVYLTYLNPKPGIRGTLRV
jgi:hypothetical protein